MKRSISKPKSIPSIYSPTRLWIRNFIKSRVDKQLPVVISIQRKFRTKAFDFYFKLVAVACDHVFFTYMLPLLFWFGYGMLARGLSVMVLSTVALTGLVKDYVMTERPKSPPAVKLSFNQSHTQEFGFPSTHSAYVVGTALYLTIINITNNESYSFYTNLSLYFLLAGLWILSLSVVFGRVYCGMHSPIDLVGGVLLGTLLSFPLAINSKSLDNYLFFEGLRGPFTISIITALVLYQHPTFTEKCICYEDTFSAISVINGIAFGTYLFSIYKTPSEPSITSLYFNYQEFGFLRTSTRIILGVMLIAVWKTIAASVLRKLSGMVFKNKLQAEQSPNFQLHAFGHSGVIYSIRNLVRIPVYFGIGFLVVFVVPWVYYIIGI
ncbi:hypothetical protein BB558_003460 [Smittium angustum]|uniref:Phosphatidic acid phosphatase type 2/haloperoxidase domain-containing protein n=1 Tax=Smittium angustum TaxID=133377 RepID=A0A2U1J644_SMIAN|nr:hypothetical protein BB558_003460 [Smittium angustum]